MNTLLTSLLLLVAVDERQPVSFVNEVLPALTKQGCNAGACHGSPTGKGGFRLSLRGYDPSLDEWTLKREIQARRVNPLRPEESLILLKPLMRVSHEGGQKLRVSDPAYRVLHRWIAEGCRIDSSSACVRIEVLPQAKTLQWPERELTLKVIGHFADGSKRDITEMVDFSSSEETVAEVNRAGFVRGRERGEAAILARFNEHVAVCNVTQLREVPGFEWSNPNAINHVDELVFARLKRLQIPPSSLCTDAEFIRRLYLDLLGVLPTTEEVKSFLADKEGTKRELLIDRVLERTEYAEYWAHRWGDLLQVKAGKLSRVGAEKMHGWLLDSAKNNLPFDRFARALLTAQGSTFTNPPASYFRTSADANSRAENTAQLFLGARIQCAKCHNHPGDTWTQDNYHGIGSFFARVEQKAGTMPGEMIVSLGGKNEIIQPLSKKTARPMLPGIGVVSIPDDKDRREVFADWLLRADNPTFAKVAVNRVWGHLFGRGLVDPVDDFRISNPPSHPELLERLASDFVKEGYDLKKLTRAILRSRIYQLSSKTLPLNQNDNRYFSHANARLMPAEVLLDAICQVTGVPEVFTGRPVGTRAVQLPGPEGENPFLKAFGQPARDTACDCERSREPRLSQALELIGGDLVTKKVRSRDSRLSRYLDDVEARLKAAGQPPHEGLVLWLDASRGVMGKNVSEWQDQSGKGHHVRQANAQLQPQLVRDGIAGLPTVRFDGRDDVLNNTTTNLLTSGAPRTVLIVGKATSTGGALFSFRRQTGGKPAFVVQQGAYQGNYYVYTDGVNGAGNSTLEPATVERIRQPFVSVHLSAGSGNKVGVRLNGEEQKVAQMGGVGKEEGSTGFVVGNREDVAGFPWGGDIAEVMVYDRVLDAKEMEQAERYLTTRYAVAAKQRVVVPPVVRDEAADRKLIEELYLMALCREPTREEMMASLAYVKEAGDRRAGLEDVLWALLTGKEFLFQH